MKKLIPILAVALFAAATRAAMNPPLPALTATGVVSAVKGKIKDEHDNGNHGSNKGKK